MKKLRLSPRLAAVAQLVPQGASFVDIGTDHAYLPVWLLLEGRIPHAIATDIREGPLARGQAVAQQWQIPIENISFRCCDGLQGVKLGEVDTIAIAGMGGETIAGILEAAPWCRNEGIGLLLQPMSSIPELRQWLFEHGYCIASEEIVQEPGHFYVVLKVRPGQDRPLSRAELWAGRQEKGRKMPLRAVYLRNLILRSQRALEGMKQSTSISHTELHEQEQLLEELIQMEQEWNTWQ